jgi:threonylcarbamoyladenosine tRNA methylthiotransferase MtaB
MRLRISSIEATELTVVVLAVLASSDIVAKHLHVPIQSGTDTILKAMNRKYNLAEFEANIERIRMALPGVSITTDIIVGFPGETAEMFAESLETVKRIGFSEMHVFPYSIRNGTKAAAMSDQVPEMMKTIRVGETIVVNEELGDRYASKFEGETLEVIVERIKDGYATGHASNYLNIKFPIDMDFDEHVVKVKVTKAGYPLCEGEVVDNK